MEENKTAPVSEMMAQSVEQARGAVQNYLNFLENSMSALPWARTDLNVKVRSYAEKNVANAFAFADKLIHAKDIQDLVRIQTEFVQTQLQALSEQVNELGATTTKTTTDAFKGPSAPST